MASIDFKIEKKIQGRLGRAGVIKTLHGEIQTPAFVVVGTKATVKAVSPEEVKNLNAQVVLANTYHLYLEPGDQLIKKAGGLQKFMNWNSPTMTDSGGFQVFSLGVAYGKEIGKITKFSDPSSIVVPESGDDSGEMRLAKIDENGVSFRSHLDGSSHYFTPEKSIEIQHNIGADIIFAFDECTSPGESYEYQKEALERTHRWAKRSLEYHKSKENAEKQALFGIVQGGRHKDLRKESARYLAELSLKEGGFDGFGIGGSFEKNDIATAVKWVNEILPEDKPRHLLGIGEPLDLLQGIENGIDTFDCVTPTRMGRNGGLFTAKGKINILNAKFKEDFTPIEKDCGCYACKNYTRAYISHLFRAKEMFAGTLASVHNLYFLIHLVSGAREAILNGEFDNFKDKFLAGYKAG